MLTIQKIYRAGAIVYAFSGLSGSKGLGDVASMLKEDSRSTYTFIFNFKDVQYMSVESIQMLKQLYALSVSNAYDIIIEQLNPQAKTMFEIFQIDSLYAVNNPISEHDGVNNESLYSA